jgi:lipopolysaccharide/colanic/teichoic acid biosynthesis glycosyltransferase
MTDDTVPLPVYGLQNKYASRPRIWLDEAVKRLFDVLVALLGLLLLAPVFGMVGLWVRRETPGPAFYWGSRLGRFGQPFKILKFRTMREDPQAYQGPRITARGDPRVTPLGRWLRETKINELPQLWNVLKGEMSLVGPRPEDPALVRTWPAEARSEILSVRPGITSPASVLYRNEESLLKASSLMKAYLDEVQPSKLRLDQLYVRHRSFLLDLDVLFWTFLVLLPRLSKYQPPEERLFWGPLSRLGRRYLNWFVIDTLVTLGAIASSGFFWRLVAPLDIGWLRAVVFSAAFALLFSIAAALLGINRTAWSEAAASEALVILGPVALSTLAGVVVESLGLIPHLPPARVIIVGGAFAFFGFVAVRYRSRMLSGLAYRWVSLRGVAMGAQERVIIVGGGDAGQFVAWLLHNGRSASGFQVVGFVDDDLYKQGMRIQGVEVLGKRRDIPQLVARYDVGLVIFAIHNIQPADRRQLLEICKDTPARVVMFPDVLAALREIGPDFPAGNRASGSLDRDNDATIPAWQDGKLACQLCLTRIDPLQVETWLSSLSVRAEAGDLEGLKAEIQELKVGMQAGYLRPKD